MCFRVGDTQLNLHGPDFFPNNNVGAYRRPGNSDICCWDGPIEEAVEHQRRHGVVIETVQWHDLGRAVEEAVCTSQTQTAVCSNSSRTTDGSGPRKQPRCSRGHAGWSPTACGTRR